MLLTPLCFQYREYESQQNMGKCNSLLFQLYHANTMHKITVLMCKFFSVCHSIKLESDKTIDLTI